MGSSSSIEWNADDHGNFADEFMNRTFTTRERALAVIPGMNEFKSNARSTFNTLEQRRILTRIMLCQTELGHDSVILKNDSRTRFQAFKFRQVWKGKKDNEPLLEVQYGVSPELFAAKSFLKLETQIGTLECTDDTFTDIEEFVKKHSSVTELIKARAGMQIYDCMIPPMPPSYGKV
jgi:hypothetical protein